MVLNAGKKLLKKIAVIRTIGKQKQNRNTVGHKVAGSYTTH